MKELIEQFIASLNKDGVLAKEQVEAFESFGAVIQSKLVEAEAKGKALAKEEFDAAMVAAGAEKEKEDGEIEEAIKTALAKVDEVKEKEIKLALCSFKEQNELNCKEEEIVERLSKYFDVVIEENLPEKQVVDYAKLERLEKTIGAIRESVLISDDNVQSKIGEITESVTIKLDETTDLLNSTIKRNVELKAELNGIKTKAHLESKIVDMPEFEQGKLRKYFAESSIEEIDTKFNEAVDKIRLKEYDVDGTPVVQSSMVKEDLIEDTGIDMFAHWGKQYERFTK